MWKDSKSNSRTVLGFGSKVSVLCFVLLVLACFSVCAWPSFITGSDTKGASASVSQLQAEKEALQQQVASQLKSLEELSQILKEQEEQLNVLKETSPEWQKLMKDAEIQSALLQSQIEELKTSLSTCETAYNELKSEYDQLVVDYNAKEKESNGYFKDLARSQARVEALEESSGYKRFGYMVGSHALIDGLDLGVGLDFGFRYRDAVLTVGADYMLSDFNVGDIKKSILDLPKNLTYKVGISWMF